MQCLWRWATARSAADAESRQPVALRGVRALRCAEPADPQVGGGHQPGGGVSLFGSLETRPAEGRGNSEPPAWAALVSLMLFFYQLSGFYHSRPWLVRSRLSFGAGLRWVWHCLLFL